MNKKLSCIFAAIVLSIALIIPTNAISRLYTFVSGGVIRSSELNAEFNQIITAINNVTSGTSVYTALTVDNLKLDANTLSSISGKLILAPLSGQDIELTPAGAGKTNITSGTLVLTALNLLMSANEIKSTDTNGNIIVTANGTGEPIAKNAASTTYLLKHYGHLYTIGGSNINPGSTPTICDLVTAGESRGVTLSAANDKITINRTGKYKVTMYARVSNNTAALDQIYLTLYKGGIATTFATNQQMSATTGWGVMATKTVIMSLTATEELTMYINTYDAQALNGPDYDLIVEEI